MSKIDKEMSKIKRRKAELERKREVLFNEDSFFLKRGRKPRFRQSMRKEGPALASFGLTNEQIANVWGIHRITLWRYLKKHPEIESALAVAKLKADTGVVKSLMKRAIGYSYVETTWKEIKIKKKDGSEELVRYKEKEVIKHMAPDVLACIYWTKNRLPEDWRDRTDLDISGHIEEDRRLIIEIVPKDGNPESVRKLAAQVASELKTTTPLALKEAVIDIEAGKEEPGILKEEK